MYIQKERETHINMDKTSDKMRIYTTEYNVMRKLDRYVEESDDWTLIEVGKIKGVVVSKIYEAPRKLLTLRKKVFVMSEENRKAASERFKKYHESKNEDCDEISLDDTDDSDDFGDDIGDDLVDGHGEEGCSENNTTSEEAAFVPQKSKPKYVKIEMFEPVR